MEAVHLAARRRRGPDGEHRVARRAAYALPHAIEHTHEEHVRPRRCKCDERSRERRDAVPEEHERPLRRRTVGDATRPDFQNAVDRFGPALDDAKRYRAGAQDARQEKRKDRIDRLARRISRERDPAEEPDGARKPEHSVSIVDC